MPLRLFPVFVSFASALEFTDITDSRSPIPQSVGRLQTKSVNGTDIEFKFLFTGRERHYLCTAQPQNTVQQKPLSDIVPDKERLLADMIATEDYIKEGFIDFDHQYTPDELMSALSYSREVWWNCELSGGQPNSGAYLFLDFNGTTWTFRFVDKENPELVIEYDTAS